MAKVYHDTLENVDYFLYLKSHFKANVDIYDKICQHFLCNNTALGQLGNVLLEAHGIKSSRGQYRHH